jgi:hypothetical protein
MKLTSVEHIGRSQLISSVRQTTGDGEERDVYTNGCRLTEPMADRVRR